MSSAMDFEEKNCRSCKERNSCQEVYRKLGQSDTPPVTKSVILAFLLPLLIFIAVLFIAEKLLKQRIKADWAVVFISFLTALLVTFIYVLLAKSVVKKGGRKPICKNGKNGNTGS
jgi:uncharacterized membrane protein (DUF485 family)